MEKLDFSVLAIISGGHPLVPVVMGGVMGATGYLVAHKEDFELEGLAVATVGGAITGAFGLMGPAGRLLQVANVKNTAEAIEYIHEREKK